MNKRVRAIIIEDGKVLLMHRVREGQEYWVFPGGGVEETDKTLEDGLKRECLEEIGVVVEVGDLFFEKSYLSKDNSDELQLLYNCKIISGDIGTGAGPEFSDRNIEQYGTYKIEWLPLSQIKDKVVYPLELRDKIV